MQFDSFEKIFSRMFQQICCNFYHFKETRVQRGLRPKLYIFFISSLIFLRFFLQSSSWNKVNKYQTWLINVYVWDLLILVTVRVLHIQFKVCHSIYVTLLTNLIRFLEDNFVTRRAIGETLNDDNCYHCAYIKIFTILSYHLKFK